jgi:regulator of replication initiation timing
MANFSDAFRAEITRVARKELRKETAALKQKLQKLSKETSTLKAACIFLKKELDRAKNEQPKESAKTPDQGKQRRYRPAMLTTFADKHGFKAAQISILLEGSVPAAYRWLEGVVPRQKHIDAFYRVKDLPKRQLLSLLDAA